MSDLVGRLEEMSMFGRRSQTISILSSSMGAEGSLRQRVLKLTRNCTNITRTVLAPTTTKGYVVDPAMVTTEATTKRKDVLLSRRGFRQEMETIIIASGGQPRLLNDEDIEDG